MFPPAKGNALQGFDFIFTAMVLSTTLTNNSCEMGTGGAPVSSARGHVCGFTGVRFQRVAQVLLAVLGNL